MYLTYNFTALSFYPSLSLIWRGIRKEGGRLLRVRGLSQTCEQNRIDSLFKRLKERETNSKKTLSCIQKEYDYIFIEFFAKKSPSLQIYRQISRKQLFHQIIFIKLAKTYIQYSFPPNLYDNIKYQAIKEIILFHKNNLKFNFLYIIYVLKYVASTNY